MGSYDGAETCELVGSLSSFSFLQNLNINIGLYRDDGLAISNATPRETDNRKYAEVFFWRGVVRSCSVMVEEYSTIAERFLTTPRRKNRAIFTQNALESLLLLQPWYDHSLQRHIRLQVYQEPPSDRLVKGIWRWHAKDDIYKTFWTCRLNNFSVILNSFFFGFSIFVQIKVIYFYF